MSSIDELLATLSALRVADIRLARAPAGTPERAAIIREIHRLERIAFADVFRPAEVRPGYPAGAGNTSPATSGGSR